MAAAASEHLVPPPDLLDPDRADPDLVEPDLLDPGRMDLDRAARSSRARAGWRAITTRGRVTAVVAAGALAVGLATGWREWIGVAVSLAVLLLAAILMSIGRSSCAVELDLQQDRMVVGEPGVASMRVRNTSHRRMLPLRMELEVAGLPVTVPVPSLHGGATYPVEVPLPTGRRAVVDLGPLRAVRGDVFGLIRRVVLWPVHRQVFVHPRTVRPTSSLPGYVHDLEGEESTKRTASDLSFHTLREYVPGDDRRFIHWKSSARNGTLQVREFLQTHRSQIAVILAGSTGEYHWADDSGGDGWGGSTRDGAGAAAVDRAEDAADLDVADPQPVDAPSRVGAEDEFEIAVGCAASLVAELVRQRRDVVTDAAGTEVRGVSADSVLDQFCAVEAAVDAPDLIFRTRRMMRRHPRVSLVVMIFGSAVGAAQIRAAVRSCPSSVTMLAVRTRSAGSPHPVRLTGSDAYSVLTVADVDELPPALRLAR